MTSTGITSWVDNLLLDNLLLDNIPFENDLWNGLLWYKLLSPAGYHPTHCVMIFYLSGIAYRLEKMTCMFSRTDLSSMLTISIPENLPWAGQRHVCASCTATSFGEILLGGIKAYVSRDI